MRTDLLIRDAIDVADIAAARVLFEAYRASLDVDLCFQDFAAELESLPGDYAAPRGCLLIAVRGSVPIGCVALRPLPSAEGAAEISTAEMKRLYVTPEVRALGVGRALAESVIERARTIGYREIKLDTLRSMSAARALYASLGFSECAPYYHNPLPGTAYLSLDLGANDANG